MNNKGKVKDFLIRIRNFRNRIKETYICKLISKILSFFGTVILIFLIIIGSLMFYYNSKAKAYEKRGITYIPPFGVYTIISGSMNPSIKVYDVVISVNESDLSKIKVGDIITFISTWDVNYGLTVTHRVVGITKNTSGEYQFTTKGDNNQSADGAPVTQENFVGKVVMRIPQLGRLQFFLATKMGWFIVVFIPALGVIIYDLYKLFKLLVLKKELNEVVDTNDLDHVYVGNENIDNRELSDADLSVTNTVPVIEAEPPVVQPNIEINQLPAEEPPVAQPTMESSQTPVEEPIGVIKPVVDIPINDNPKIETNEQDLEKTNYEEIPLPIMKQDVNNEEKNIFDVPAIPEVKPNPIVNSNQQNIENSNNGRLPLRRRNKIDK